MANVINIDGSKPTQVNNPFKKFKKQESDKTEDTTMVPITGSPFKKPVKKEDITTTITVPVIDSTERQNNASPFDQIRHEDEKGEYWFARELQGILGYVEWRKFEDAIKRAVVSIDNIGKGSENHIVNAAKMVSIGSGAQREVQDYRLTRYGSYMIAMNGDPRKPEIAAAQTYFAIRTRQAELQTSPQQQVQVPKTPAMAILEMAKAMVAMEEKQNEQNEQNLMVQNQISGLISTDQKLQEQIDANNAAIQELRQQRIGQSNNTASVLTEEARYNPITADGDITIREFSDILVKDYGFNDMGIVRLNRYLVDNDMLQQLKKGYKAKKRYLDLGWFVNEVQDIQIASGDIIERFVVYVTPKGRQALFTRIESRYH